MLRTLLYIPNEIAGLPVFGMGWAVVLWLLVAGALLVRAWRKAGWNEECSSQLMVMALVSVVLVWVLPNVVEPIPAGSNVFPPVAAAEGIPIRGYGMMLLLGVVSGVSLAAWRARRAGLDPEVILALAFYIVIGGIVGARLLFIFQYWHLLRGPTLRETLVNLFSVDKGGLIVYGSLIGAALTFLVFCWKYRIHPLPLADLIAPSMALGLALGRVGCLLNGCCFGGPAHLPWAVTFPRDSPPYESQKESGTLYGLRLVANEQGEATVAEVLPSGAFAAAGLRMGDTILAINGQPARGLAGTRELLRSSPSLPQLSLADGRQVRASDSSLPARSLPVHPAQLYSALNGLILCGVALAFYPFRQRHGQVIALLLTLYAITRFMEERIRIDEQALLASLTMSEAISVGLAIAMSLLWMYIASQPRIGDT